MTETTSIDRRTAIVDDLGPLQETFVVKTRDYKLQYAHLYFMRLMLMRPVVLQQANAKWGNNTNICLCRMGAVIRMFGQNGTTYKLMFIQ